MLGVGQQFLAYAIHPDTGQPYTWPGRELVDTPIAELPEITEQQALDFIAYFESIVPPDWTPVTRKSERLRREGIHKTSKTPFAPISKLRLALDAIPIASNDPYDTWLKVGVALYHASEGSQDALALWHEWSRKGSKYNPDALDQRWKGFGRAPGKSYLSAASIFQWADNADPSWRDRAREQERIEHERAVQRLVEKMANEAGTHDADDAGDAGVPPSFKIFSLAEFDGKPIPEREWVVEGLIPARNVTDLSGDGGVGKSQLALQLAVAVATGSPWLGHKVARGKVLYLSAEDEIDEIRRRTTDVAERQGLTLAALSNFHLIDLTREFSTELAKIDPADRQSLVMTPLFTQIEAAVATLRPKLVILDTRADLYGGNENERVQVRTFIHSLQQLCRTYDMAILMLSHPSRAGLAGGDGQSGSTAWGNSVRSRLYLKRTDDKDADPDLRVLSSEKANYGPTATEINLRWESGVFRRVDTLIGGKVPDRAALARHVDERFMQQLADAELRGDYVNGNKTGSHYAPKVFAKLDASSPDRIGEKHYEAAMWRLTRTGRIAIGKTDGPPTKQYDKFVAVDPMSPLKFLAEQQGSAA